LKKLQNKYFDQQISSNKSKKDSTENYNQLTKNNSHFTPKSISKPKNDLKLRSLDYNCLKLRFLTTSLNSQISEWDLEKMREIRVLDQNQFRELTCAHFSIKTGLYSIGACGKMIIIDPRYKKCITRIVEMDEEDCSVRSIEEIDGVVSYGTSNNFIGFYDLTAGKHLGKNRNNGQQILKLNSANAQFVSNTDLILMLGEENNPDLNKTAIYSHKYRPVNPRDLNSGRIMSDQFILACGGPLITGLHGSKMSLFSTCEE